MDQKLPVKRITNEDLYYLLGQIVSEQKSTLALLQEHIEEDRRRWDAIHHKTDKLETKISYWTGAAAILSVVAVTFAHKILGW